MTMLAPGAMAVAAGVIGSVAAPSVAERIVGGEDDEVANLAAATAVAAGQARDVGHSFGRLIPARAGAAQEGDDDLRREVAEALAAVAAGRSGLVANERSVVIEALRDAWGPRYRQAEAERRRLGYRIEPAERAARADWE